MAQLTVKLSAKADALISQLQKEIFNRRRKKITPAGVVESLVESASKSQSDKRYSSSWNNLIKDIEKAAKVCESHGNKPASLSAEEWAMVLSHRTRKSPKTNKKKTAKGAGRAKSKEIKNKASTTKNLAQAKATDSSGSK